MPTEYHTWICDIVKACYPNDFVPSDHGEVTLKARHFCVWNRYTESVRIFLVFCLIGC